MWLAFRLTDVFVGEGALVAVCLELYLPTTDCNFYQLRGRSPSLSCIPVSRF